MKIGITYRLFLAILTATFLAVVGMFLIMQWSIDRGFLRYVNSLEQKRIVRLAERLERVMPGMEIGISCAVTRPCGAGSLSHPCPMMGRADQDGIPPEHKEIDHPEETARPRPCCLRRRDLSVCPSSCWTPKKSRCSARGKSP